MAAPIELAAGNVFEEDSLSELLEDFTEIRYRLDAALRASQEERRRMQGTCGLLMDTLTAIRQGRRIGAANTASQKPAESQTVVLTNPLTNRETQVLRLIAEGLSTKEIAGQLNISFKTAVTHRTSILQKVGVHETASLVRYAIRVGLVA